jgi:hypothetical protein
MGNTVHFGAPASSARSKVVTVLQKTPRPPVQQNSLPLKHRGPDIYNNNDEKASWITGGQY